MQTESSVQKWQVYFTKKLYGDDLNVKCLCGKPRTMVHCAFCGSSSWYVAKKYGQYDTVRYKNATYQVPVVTCKKCGMRYNLLETLIRCEKGEEMKAAQEQKITQELITVADRKVVLVPATEEQMAAARTEYKNTSDEDVRKAALAKMFGLDPTDVVKKKGDESS